MISLLEVVLGPFWVWLAVGQRPSVGTVIGGAVVVAAVILQARDPTALRRVGRAEAGAQRPSIPPVSCRAWAATAQRES